MNLEKDTVTAVNLLDKKPFSAFIVIILSISGLVYYFIIREQLQDVQQERDYYKNQNRELYNLIIKSRSVIDKQSVILDTYEIPNTDKKNEK